MASKRIIQKKSSEKKRTGSSKLLAEVAQARSTSQCGVTDTALIMKEQALCAKAFRASLCQSNHKESRKGYEEPKPDFTPSSQK